MWGFEGGVRGTKKSSLACTETRAIREQNEYSGNYGIYKALKQRRWAWEKLRKAEGLEKPSELIQMHTHNFVVTASLHPGLFFRSQGSFLLCHSSHLTFTTLTITDPSLGTKSLPISFLFLCPHRLPCSIPLTPFVL